MWIRGVVWLILYVPLPPLHEKKSCILTISDSLSYLPISDATVLTFLIPTLTALVCFLWLREPFTPREALAALIAFSGVLLVARPTWLFPNPPIDPITGEPEANAISLTFHATGHAVPAPLISPTQRTLAVLAAIVIPILRVAEHKGKEAAQVKPDNSSQDIEVSDRTLAQARAEVDASARQKLNVQ